MFFLGGGWGGGVGLVFKYNRIDKRHLWNIYIDLLERNHVTCAQLQWEMKLQPLFPLDKFNDGIMD